MVFPIQSQENVILEVFLHKTHVLFQKLHAFIKGRVSIEKGARRLFVDEWILFRNLCQQFILVKNLMNLLHAAIIQKAARDEDDAALHFARIFHIVNLFS